MEKNIYQDIPEEYQTPGYSFHTEERNVSVLKELSPQEHLKEQLNWLQGRVWDDVHKRFVEVEGVRPFMNQEGINMYFQFATAVLSPIVTFSNYRSEEQLIHRLVAMIVKKASAHFHLHWRDYDIKRKTQITVLTDKLTILGLSAFYKALGGGDRKAGTSNITESINTTNQAYGRGHEFQQVNKGGGFFSRMNPFSR